MEPYLFIITVSSMLGLASGFIMHRADYCVMGMFRDFFLFKDNFMLRILLLHIVISAVLFELARLSGLLSLFPFPLLGSISLANVLGGVLFGIGMVLAGGCVVGTLYKMGAGSLVSLVAFVGLVIGATLYAEIHPAWKIVIENTTLFKGQIILAQIIDINQTVLIALVVLPSAYYLYRSYRKTGLSRTAYAENYIQPWKAAVYFSLIGLISYVLIGMPLGITTSYSKFGASLESLLVPEHVAGLAYFQAVPLNYSIPFFETTVSGGAGAAMDGIAAIQYPLIIGIVLGAFVSAILLREFQVIYKIPGRHYVSALFGGIVLGLAARMTPACNVWHLWGGLPVLAGQSLLFLIGLFPGAWLGGLLLKKLVIRQE